MVWATLCVFRPLEIRRMLGIELSLMNDHNVIVRPKNYVVNTGQRPEDCEDKWDLIVQIDLPDRVMIRQGVEH